MRTEDLFDWLALRRTLARPWEFLRLRGREEAGRILEVPLRDGRAARLRSGTMDRHILHRLFARDEYRLRGIPPLSLGVVIDVGAHIGLFALRAAPLAGRVLAYEPSPANRALLLRNVEGLANVEVHAQALAGSAGMREMVLAGDPAGHRLGSAKPGGGAQAVPVRCTTLEEVFREHGLEECALLKLDCEGAEHEIVASAPAALWRRVHRVVMEYHPAAGAGSGSSGPALAERLERSGHRVQLVPSRRTPGRGHLYSRLAAPPGVEVRGPPPLGA